jgi:hypothetical protein
MNVIVRWSLTVVVVVGLAIDAFNHFHVAHNYVFNKTSTISEATLFRIEAVLAILAALAVIIRASRWTFAAALAVAGGGLVLLVVYRYNNVGKIGPLPNMYEPTWDVPGKKWSVVGEVIAIVGSLGLLSTSFLGSKRAATHRSSVS